MPVLYFDNFRGFNKTFLPLKDVNFFVGENSTGKTSVLKLIKILSDHKFWFTQEFISDDADLGYYSEIASISNKNQTYFEIGILGDSNDIDNGISAVKIKFEKKEELPSISEINLIIWKINIQAIFQKDSIEYRYKDIDLKNITETNKVKYFKNWIIDNGLGNEIFKKNDQKGFRAQMPLLFKMQDIIEKENKSKTFYLPNFLQDIAWLAPIRTEPKRTYDNYKITFNPNGTHTPYILNKKIGKNKTGKDSSKFKNILEKFGKDSGLFDSIKINQLGEEGTAPFEIQIILNNQPLKITNVGYGVSQILPLIIEVLARNKNSWFAIQQPEIHLHPRAQAAFGDFILKAVVQENKSFIIETHSDYTIDRFRLKLNMQNSKNEKKNIKELKSQIVFFNRQNDTNTLTCIPILKNGQLPNDQPSEFRNFFINEQLDLLNI